jgi:regulator of cell morphogenesis and NO signaling
LCLEKLHADLLNHIQREESILFPSIAQMDQDLHVASCSQDAYFESVMQPIRIMVLEHDAADRNMDELRSLTHGYEPPDWACTTHIAFLRGLQELELDLKQHEHLENDILFPRAIQLEAALSKRR